MTWIKNLYYYIFYRLNNLFKILSFGLSDITEWSAMTILSILETFNVFAIVSVLEINGINNIHFNNKSIAMSIMLFILVVNFFILIKNRNYIKIIDKFSGNTKANTFYPIVFYTYVILSIWLVFSLGDKVRQINIDKKVQEKGYLLPKMPS